ncbi:MAG: hypothetical protein ACLU9M_11260 [Lachnospirales bacterium]|jgi:hypothetical protein
MKLIKVIILTLSLFIVSNSTLCYGAIYDKDEYNEICKVLQENNIVDEIKPRNTYINRKECIKGVMRVIGTTDEVANEWSNVSFYEPIFSDMAEEDNGYVIFAGVHRIALGIPEVIAVVSNNKYYANNFKPKNSAKVKDCVAFIMRCIEERENAEDCDKLFSDAEKMGLISKNDSFYNDKYLYAYAYYNMLYRMLNEQRYYYVKEYVKEKDMDKGYTIFDLFTKDEEGKMTYLEFLKQREK